MSDFYAELGVPKDASEDDIKKAYKRKAMKAHPDRNDGDDSKFLVLHKAYETLINPDKRARYDHIGETESAATPLEEMARDHLCRSYLKLLVESDYDVLHVDVIKTIESRIVTDLHNQLEGMLDAERKQRKMEMALPKFSVDDGRVDVLFSATQQEIAKIEKFLDAQQQHREVLRKALELLRHFKFDFDKPIPKELQTFFPSTTYYL